MKCINQFDSSRVQFGGSSSVFTCVEMSSGKSSIMYTCRNDKVSIKEYVGNSCTGKSIGTNYVDCKEGECVCSSGKSCSYALFKEYDDEYCKGDYEMIARVTEECINESGNAFGFSCKNNTLYYHSYTDNYCKKETNKKEVTKKECEKVECIAVKHSYY